MKEKDFSIGDNLKRLRKAAGYSQREVAALMDVPQSSISQYENKGIYPPVPLFLKMCALYHVTDILKEFDKSEFVTEELILLPGEVGTVKKLRELSDDNYFLMNNMLDSMLEVQNAYDADDLVPEDDYYDYYSGYDEEN